MRKEGKQACVDLKGTVGRIELFFLAVDLIQSL